MPWGCKEAHIQRGIEQRELAQRSKKKAIPETGMAFTINKFVNQKKRSLMKVLLLFTE